MQNARRLPLAFAALLVAASSVVAQPAPNPAARAKISEVYGKLPLTFEVNQGQVDRSVKFLSRGQGTTLFLTPAEAVLILHGAAHETSVVRMQLVGANRAPRLVGEEPQATKSNYFIGNDVHQWHTGVSHYSRVRVEGVYPGIDLVYRGDQRRLEYDLVLAPGADPERIRLAFRGADSITIGAQGELILHTASGDLVQPRPTVYQEVKNQRRPVAGHYVLLAPPAAEREGDGHRPVGFVVGSFDHARALIIDPVLAYSTFLGGRGQTQPFGIAVDGAGNAYVTGTTSSTTFPGVTRSSIQPASGGSLDAFVTKINAAGTAIVYSTFLGGSGGDSGLAIAVDGGGNAYVTGTTTSTTFPGVTGSSIQPANAGDVGSFVTKINAAGTAIVYSTFLHGNGGFNDAFGIAVDGSGNAYVTGITNSTTFPGVTGSSVQPAYGGGFEDAFVTKINAAGTAIVYSTFLGGSGGDGGFAIAVDGSGNAYVTGSTDSMIFPGNFGPIQPAYGGGTSDAFVTKINAAGTAIVYSTFLGGGFTDEGGGIAVDGSGNAYVTGRTNSTTFPGVTGSSIQPAYGGGRGDAFVTKINAEGTAIVYSTFLGGSDADGASGIAVDGSGNVYVTGATHSATFPGVTGTSIQPANAGGFFDAFVTKINAEGTAIVYSTFLGGSGADTAVGIAVDGLGNAYVAGFTDSATFPGVTGSSIQPARGGDPDGFVTKVGTVCGGDPANSLCLNDGRFRVTAHFDAGGGNAGTAHVVLLTPDTGFLWFFGSSSVEAVVKVLDGCGVNGRYWFFAGGLTNVKVVMTVTDTKTGVARTYTNPPNTTFQPIQDTSAFATCP